MSIRFNVNLFNGEAIVADNTLTPSDGTAAGSSEIVTGIGNDTDLVVTIRNPNNVAVQMYWAPAVSLPNLHRWDELGAASPTTQQTPMRLRKGFSYRFEAAGAGVEATLDIGPESIEYDEYTDQGLRA